MVNVYIPESQYYPDEHTQTFFNLAQVLNGIRVPTLLLGDFNTHHPNWGGRDIQSDPTGELLCEIQQVNGLQLLTPSGTVTFQRGHARSTIDLAFASSFFTERTTYCIARDSWVSTRDHIPVEIRFLARVRRAEPLQRWNHKKMRMIPLLQSLVQDWQAYGLLPSHFELKQHQPTQDNNHSQNDSLNGSQNNNQNCQQNHKQNHKDRHTGEPILQLPEGFDHYSTKLLTLDEIDQWITYIVKSIQNALNSYCQKTRPSEHARRDWSPRCSKLV